MSLESLIQYFTQYGAVAIFVVVLLEYMNLPGHRAALEKNFEMLRRKGCAGVFVGKLIPVMRTLISIPAGVLKLNFWKYTVSSALGVAVWNLVFVGAGYFLGDAVFRYLG